MEHLVDSNFDEKIKSGKVLIQFTATWCGPCKALTPLVESLEITKFKVDADDAPDLLRKFGIRSVPTLILFKDGQEVSRKVGLLKKEALEAFINS